MAGFDPNKPEWTSQPFDNGAIVVEGDGRIDRDPLHDKLKDVNTGSMSIKAQAWGSAQGTLDTISSAISEALTTVKQSWKSDGAQLAYDRLHVTQLSASNIATASGKIGTGISAIASGVDKARGSHGASSENFGDKVYNTFGGDGNEDAASATFAALIKDVNSGLDSMPRQLETQLKSQGSAYNAPVSDVGTPQIPTTTPTIGPGGGMPSSGSVPAGSIPKPPDTNTGVKPGTDIDTGIKPGTDIDTNQPPVDTITDWPPRDPTTNNPVTGGPDYPTTGTITDPSYTSSGVPSLDTSSQLAGVGDGSSFGSGSSSGGFGGSGSAGFGGGGSGSGSAGFGGGGAGAGTGGLAGAGSASGLSGRGSGLSGSGSGLAGSGAAGSGGGTGSGAGAGSAAAGRGGMMGGAPMGGRGGGGGGGDDDERERTTWLTEDEDVWGATKAPPGVIS